MDHVDRLELAHRLEAWVPALGDANHGFPFLSGMGRLVIKDSIMQGAAFLSMTDAARESLRRRKLSLDDENARRCGRIS